MRDPAVLGLFLPGQWRGRHRPRAGTGQLVGAWVASEGLLSNPSRKAKSQCKAQTGDPDCEVVVTLARKDRLTESKKQTDQLLDEVQRFMDSAPTK